MLRRYARFPVLKSAFRDPPTDVLDLLPNGSRTDSDVTFEWIVEDDQQQQNESNLTCQRRQHQCLGPHIRYSKEISEPDSGYAPTDQQYPKHGGNGIAACVDSQPAGIGQVI